MVRSHRGVAGERMLHLREHGIIFLKSRKVGGTSLEIALSKYANEDDTITPITAEDEELRKSLGFRGPQNFQSGLYNHISAVEARAIIGSNLFDEATKISIVRSPFDYMISSYFWEIARGDVDKNLSFEDYVLNNVHKLIINNQYYQIDGKNVIDHYVRFDKMIEDLRDIEAKFPQLTGLAKEFTQIKAKSQYRPEKASVSEVYKRSPRARRLICQVSFFQIERFGFEIPD